MRFLEFHGISLLKEGRIVLKIARIVQELEDQRLEISRLHGMNIQRWIAEVILKVTSCSPRLYTNVVWSTESLFVQNL
jgi:hypothetical protein